MSWKFDLKTVPVKQLSHPRSDIFYTFSYPRSGSTWMRYCFEFITKRLSLPAQYPRWQTGARDPQFMYFTHEANNQLYRLHERFPISHSSFIKYMILIRNPIEALTSQILNYFSLPMWNDIEYVRQHWFPSVVHLPPSIEKLIPRLSVASIQDRLIMFGYFLNNSARFRHTFERIEASQLLRILALHEHLSSGMVIRYEEFMLDPGAVLLKLIDYLDHNFKFGSSGLPPREEMIKNLDELIDNYSFHRALCLNAYKSEPAGDEGVRILHLAASSTDRTSDLRYYSRQLGEENIKLINNFLGTAAETTPFGKLLYNKYLSYYEESS